MSADSRRDRTRPAELIGLAGVLALFAGVIIGVTTRDFTLALIFGVGIFMVALVVFAMLILAFTPNDAIEAATSDGDETDPPSH